MNPSSPAAAIGKSKQQQGFTILEVLVAFVLLSLALTVILQIFSGGLRNAAAAGHYARATIIADSKLAMLGTLFPLEEGEHTGEEENFSWRMQIEPYQEADELNNPTTGRYPLYIITLRVQWRHSIHEPELQFVTYRLAAPDDS